MSREARCISTITHLFATHMDNRSKQGQAMGIYDNISILLTGKIANVSPLDNHFHFVYQKGRLGKHYLILHCTKLNMVDASNSWSISQI